MEASSQFKFKMYGVELMAELVGCNFDTAEALTTDALNIWALEEIETRMNESLTIDKIHSLVTNYAGEYNAKEAQEKANRAYRQDIKNKVNEKWNRKREPTWG